VNRHWSEDLALEQLLASGLKLVCRNYWTRRGEIDLVMRDGNELVFVEVRQRTNTAYGRPEETVNRSKRARLRLAASHFLQQYAEFRSQPCRFDIFAVTGNDVDNTCQWITDAF
jgi:putative endonuclease